MLKLRTHTHTHKHRHTAHDIHNYASADMSLVVPTLLPCRPEDEATADMHTMSMNSILIVQRESPTILGGGIMLSFSWSL